MICNKGRRREPRQALVFLLRYIGKMHIIIKGTKNLYVTVTYYSTKKRSFLKKCLRHLKCV